MLAGNGDHFSILLRFLGLLVGVVGLVVVLYGFRVARVNFCQFTSRVLEDFQNDGGFGRISRILIFQKF